jgi:D,D-heptose 1,7-bisphosphate phosphatase
MQAVILAGGRGTRLGNITREIPKPMVLIGDKPLLHHQIDLLSRYGIREVIILVNYLKETIIEYFGDGSGLGIHIRYFVEPLPLGTVGGIKEIENWITGDFLVLYGDVMVNMDLQRLFTYHLKKNSQCTLVLHPNDHPYDSDLVETGDTGMIVGFHSKPHEPETWYHNLVNAGVYVLSPTVLGWLEKGRKADFGQDVFPAIMDQLHMYGYRTSEYLKDMGTPERLEKVRSDLDCGKISRRNYEYPQKAVFLDRDGVLNVERSYISKPEELELYDFAPAAIRKINGSDYHSIVVTNQSVIARNLATEKDVDTIHAKMETLLGEQQAWLDGIYYCPHHPDKGFPEENAKYKIDCDCRKPKTGMFRKAMEDFCVVSDDSYMIGDTERDVQAGINAGCVTIGVRTGYGIRKTKVLPDYQFANLIEAANFIVDDPYRQVTETIIARYEKEKNQHPWVLLIGGNTRTGKSTLASYLRIAFSKKGQNVMQVGLDNWLLPEEQRSRNMNVYDRFRLPVLVSDLNKLFRGETLSISTYVNHPERIPDSVTYNPKGIHVILVEGVVALSSPEIRELANCRLFTTLGPAQFRQRIDEYYAWRGKSREETSLLVEKREQDEYQFIEKESKFADLIINPTTA